MNKSKIGALLKIFGLTMLIIALVVLGFCYYTKTNKVIVAETELVLLPELKWGSYERVTQELQSLSRKFHWQLETPGQEASITAPAEKGLPAEALSAALRRELAERQALLADELKLRRRLIEMEIESRVQQRQNQDQHVLQETVEEERRRQAAELADFRRQKEKEYSSKLATLYFKLEIPDLAIQERSRLATEISALEKELAQTVKKKSETLVEELKRFENKRRQEAAVELQAYRRRLEAEGEEVFNREQQALEAEFNAWVDQNGAISEFLTESSD